MGQSPGVYLITGCGTGIGRDAAFALARRGHYVVATARREESCRDLGEQGAAFGERFLVCRLDVTDPQTIEAAVGEARGRFGQIDGVVNNAGIGVLGAVDDLPDEAIREQFEVNVLGVVRVCRAVLPGMREARRGRLVHVGSVVGRVSLPFLGHYCATKHALEALADAQRIELRPFGIRVSLVEPGHIDTAFDENLEARTMAWLREDSPYRAWYEAVARARSQRRSGGRRPPALVTRAILHALLARRPRARYPVTPEAVWLPRIRRLVPTAWFDRGLSRYFGIAD